MAQMVKNLPAMQGDPGSISGLGRSPGEGHGYPLQCSCLENPMDSRAWQGFTGLQSSWGCIVHGSQSLSLPGTLEPVSSCMTTVDLETSKMN